MMRLETSETAPNTTRRSFYSI